FPSPQSRPFPGRRRQAWQIEVSQKQAQSIRLTARGGKGGMNSSQIVQGPSLAGFSAAAQAFDAGRHNTRRVGGIDLQVEYMAGIAVGIENRARFMNPGQDRSGLLQHLAELSTFWFRQGAALSASQPFHEPGSGRHRLGENERLGSPGF